MFLLLNSWDLGPESPKITLQISAKVYQRFGHRLKVNFTQIFCQPLSLILHVDEKCEILADFYRAAWNADAV